MIGVRVFRCLRVCVYVCVCNCVSRSSHVYSSQPGQKPASFPCPLCEDGYHAAVHQALSFTYTPCHCSPSRSLPLCNYKVASRLRRLSARDWPLDIESGKGRGVPSPPPHNVPSILLPGGPTAVSVAAAAPVHPCQHLRCILSCPSLCR